jgi:hypothetical protein
MSKEITKPERVMYYEGSKMSFLEYVDQLEAYVEKLEEAINYTRCCTELKDKEANNFEYWLIDNKYVKISEGTYQGNNGLLNTRQFLKNRYKKEYSL